MILRYIGPKSLPYILNTPIPFLAHSEKSGTLEFNPDVEVQDDWAQFLLTECAGAFECVGGMPVPKEDESELSIERPKHDPLQYVGKRFSGKNAKWNAWAFIKRHKAEEILGLRKLQIKERVIFWELVPIAIADVMPSDEPAIWNKGKKNHYPSWNKGKQNHYEPWNKGLTGSPQEQKAQKRAQKHQDPLPVATAGVLHESVTQEPGQD